LAQQLSKSGLHVLRFDFSSCGDSNDLDPAGNLVAWMDDLQCAIEELKDGSNVAHIGLIGLRLGGSIAMLVSARRRDVDLLVMWDPVISGKDYIDELRNRQSQWLQGSFAGISQCPESANDNVFNEITLTQSMRTNLESLDLFSIELQSTDILIIDTQATGGTESLYYKLRQFNPQTEFRKVHAPAVWLKSQDQADNLNVPTNVIAEIGDWVTRCSQ
jgi:pimeloyl-ACP methyl ester carboxylesterase